MTSVACRMIVGERWNLMTQQEIPVEFGPEDAVAAAERLICPAGGGLPMVAEATPTSSTADVVRTLEPHDVRPFDRPVATASRHRMLAVVLLIVFLVPFLATAVRTIVR